MVMLRKILGDKLRVRIGTGDHGNVVRDGGGSIRPGGGQIDGADGDAAFRSGRQLFHPIPDGFQVPLTAALEGFQATFRFPRRWR